MLDEIYNALNEECEDEDSILEDAFEESNWKAGNELIIDVSLSEDGFVKPSLAKYKKLLEVAGSGTLKSGEDSDDNSSQDYQDVKVNQQGELLLKTLQKSLKTGLSEPLNDVIFIVKDQKIAANRLVLASAADHFKHTFSIKYRDGNPLETVTIPGYDIEPDSFRVLLNYLYRISLDTAIVPIKNQNGNKYSYKNIEEYWSQEQENERQFDILMDLLEASDYYNIINLKNETEKKLFEYVKLCNIDEALDHARIIMQTC
ncbi:putative Sacsin [Gigaspora margarita]|uniref:Putative Sacsin n=1 Tax=Gigaspora margarita TaxID=4874 RepID=A0A8H4A906_GIGMA|nr:putative Sacsin [Gigaspora margarita]